MTNDKKALSAVRAEIDAIDEQIQDLLIRRTQVVEQVRAIKHGVTVKIRPAREAEMMYRLTERHHGNFPKRELCRIWREIIVATLSFEGPFSVAVIKNEDEPGYWDLARDQYGSFTKMTRHESGRAIVEAVRRQESSVGIVPWPRRDDPDPWWRYTVSEDEDTPRIIARLPFIPGASVRGDGIEAAVICPIAQEATGRDRSFLAIETNEEVGGRRIEDALNSIGISAAYVQHWHDPNRPPGWIYLIETFGLVDPSGKQFPRIQESIGQSVARIVHLGGYGTPLGERDVAPDGDDT